MPAETGTVRVTGKQRPVGENEGLLNITLDAWDLRHLVLSLEDKPRHESDAADLENVVARAVTALSALPRRPTITVPAGAALVQGLPL